MVLTPRNTKLLSPHPVLRWKPVEGAAIYRVIVRGGGLSWSSQVKGTQLVYPETAPKLVPGTDYKLIVETSDRSSYEPGRGLGFSILDPKDRRIVEKEEGQIRGLGLPEGPTQFLIAHLYATNGLNAEAIQRLEGVSTTFKVAAVTRLLGGLYLEVGLTRQAEASYLRSLDLSKEEKDEEGQMLAHLALARIYDEALGNSKSATQHLDEALALANKVGDEQVASQTHERLAKLK